MEKQIAVFGAGCFWNVQHEFDKLEGIKTEVGFMAGDDSIKDITYKKVCTGRTGHAEIIKIEYDKNKISYKKLLDLFWKIHDPTTKDKQGPDFGSQYRSIIIYFNENQKKLAEKSKAEMQKNFKDLIVTEIIYGSKMKFHKAEEYHQKYFEKTGEMSCKI